MLATPPDVDVLIVGAGISGIGMAAHMGMKAPHHSYAIVERRENLGGTWDLFRYPGIRSDSDMHTLGFDFEPWKHEKSIADAPAILDYLHKIVDERGIREHIRFGLKVISADFREDETRWHVEMEADDGSRTHMTANWLYLGAGYYDYDDPYDAGFDFSEYEGQVIHPQFWPENLEYAGKKVLVVGSGATAVTIVPSMADKAASVTMLQRTPTWMFARPAKDRIANLLRKVLPEEIAYKITRFKNIHMQDLSFKTARDKPEKVSENLHKRIEKALGPDYNPEDFTPPYNPWEQRVCLVPDDDLFKAMKAGKAQIVTGHIEKFEANGARLTDGTLIEADIIITATGLKLAVAGKIAVSVNGEPVQFNERFYYKGCMFSNLPNLAVVFGYLNASWTLRADINSDYICRVLNRQREKGAQIVTPVLTPEAEAQIEEDDVFDFSSGYIQRSKHIMPRNAVRYPWRLNQDYLSDRKELKESPVEDGLLTFKRAGSNARTSEEQLEAAE
ncbi:putative flavoprotein CzcO associated with the cation diffusion facilitator CzcD [Erythrobacter litoralis]|jgi:cation diffusion facilitator CzcD-associated flavoprotein CzcO|uniref:FAD-containing monooxygenase EthA n=1 Tax=Erythrobacter litoralis TaxID=39960 RepID=A0A074M9A6_9SPHN|nr:NAD(P)/FAD-dependent oxidoreductase [Erythrobacter litoralis]AOL24617.1 putative flavoprotein CzcO associated with the cation diffusion facilitator CzcD [Erythrobacter litoralis]KEO89350.1 FAD-containing monooxygenase EthA [Erythrobacter litoralis]MEE4337679.1 NAD(P)/FAD-dependent oxidoreductase [Erythrobacter sp.]